jgi:hypothetical protein
VSSRRWAVAALLAVAVGAFPAVAHAAPNRPNNAFPDNPTVAGKFVPVKPTRLLDTRDGTGEHGVVRPVGPNASIPLDVSGVAGDPTLNITAVVLNVTVTDATADSFLAISGDAGRPATSNINFRAGQTVPNLVTAQVARNNMLFLYNHAGSVDVVADVFGYYSLDRAGSSFTTVQPTRLLDTREGVGAVGPGGTLPLQVTGRNSIPASGVTAVQLNVTVTNPTAGSFLSVFPSGTALPNVSNLNFDPGETIANSVIVPVGQDGRIDFFNHVGRVDVVADISGYFTGNPPGTYSQGGVYESMPAPTRILDTRTDTGPIGPGEALGVTIKNLDGMQLGTPTAVVLNVTVTNPTANSFVTAYPDGIDVPTASNIDFTPGETLSNLVVVPVSPGGDVDFFNHVGTTDLVVDVFGYYMNGSGLGIESLGFAQPTVDATTGNAVVNLNWTVTDGNIPHNLYGEVVLRLAGADPNTYVGQPVVEGYALSGACCGAATFVSGDGHRSSYTYAFPVPKNANAATAHWVVQLLTIGDDQGHQLVAAGSDLDEFGANLAAASVVGATGPTLQPDTLRAAGDLYGGQANYENYTFQLQGDGSSFWRGTITVTGPGGRTLTTDFAQSRVDGQETATPCQGALCTVPVMFPPGLPEGQWTVTKLVLVDNTGTATTYTSGPVVNVGDDTDFSAGGFTLTPNPVDNWRQPVDVMVSMRINGPTRSIGAINLSSDCPVVSEGTTPFPDGAYRVAMHMTQAATSCTVNGIEIVDAAGNVAVYGQRYSAPDLGLVATRMADTTPPKVLSVSVNPATVSRSLLPHTVINGGAQLAAAIAPIEQCTVYVYDATGKIAGQLAEADSDDSGGLVGFTVPLPADAAAGVYTVGFTLTDTGNLSTSYGTPGGNPMPGGPLTVTVTDN